MVEDAVYLYIFLSYLSVILAMPVALQQIENRYLIFDMLVKSILVSSKNGLGRDCGRYGRGALLTGFVGGNCRQEATLKILQRFEVNNRKGC
jgi:hypothetical protein